MAEYIEREAISEEIRKYYYKNPPNSSYGEGFDRGLDRAQRAILDAPAADVAPVIYGKWINITRFNDGERIIATCSRCKDRGDIRTIRTEFGIWEIDSPYCPNCGAKMQEVE